ncbi:unnamed protein product, partial [Mesorhabditis spiculigera]
MHIGRMVSGFGHAARSTSGRYCAALHEEFVALDRKNKNLQRRIIDEEYEAKIATLSLFETVPLKPVIQQRRRPLQNVLNMDQGVRRAASVFPGIPQRRPLEHVCSDVCKKLAHDVEEARLQHAKLMKRAMQKPLPPAPKRGALKRRASTSPPQAAKRVRFAPDVTPQPYLQTATMTLTRPSFNIFSA